LKLVFVTQELDPAHPALAATSAQVAALARRVDELVVLAGSVVPAELPGNCRARTFRAARRPARGARFEAALAHELRGLNGVVAHMSPIYAVLAAPLVRPFRIPLVLWFAHWRASTTLRLAERASTAVVSVDRRSFPLPSKKLRAIGHGIELSEFTCSDRDGEGTLRLLALGRYSPAKGLDVVVRALAGTDATLTVHGPALTHSERAHRADLERLVEELGLADRVRLEGAVARAEVPTLLAHADALVNNMRAGAPDKVVYEAAASCLPVLASNHVFDDLLAPELRFARDSPDQLAERVRGLAELDGSARAELGRKLRRRVEERHTVDGWAEGVLQAAGLA
jgi:glycosyltransferase involved in cell wall biosynthesis